MARHSRRLSMGLPIYMTLCIALSGYFSFAAIQGDFGLFKRVEVDAESAALQQTYDDLAQEIATLENKTRRLSDEFLDLDLLDEQARDVLGLTRPNEIVVR